MTTDYFRTVMSEELEVVKAEVGEERWNAGRFDAAAALLEHLCVSEDFDTFLTLGAYEKI